MTSLNNFYTINSIDRTSGTQNNFTVEFPNFINSRGMYIGITSAVIPGSFYTVNNLTNTFEFTEIVGITTSNISAPLTNGNYNASTLATHLGAIMTAASQNAVTYTATVSQTTGKLTITTTTGAVGTYTIRADDSTCNKILGLTDADQVPINFNSTQTLANVINLVGPQYIHIKINEIGNNGFYYSKIGTKSTIMAVIPKASETNFSSIYYNNDEPILAKLTSDEVSLSIEVTDERDEDIDLNGVDWCFVLKFFPLEQIKKLI